MSILRKTFSFEHDHLIGAAGGFRQLQSSVGVPHIDFPCVVRWAWTGRSPDPDPALTLQTGRFPVRDFLSFNVPTVYGNARRFTAGGVRGEVTVSSLVGLDIVLPTYASADGRTELNDYEVFLDIEVAQLEGSEPRYRARTLNQAKLDDITAAGGVELLGTVRALDVQIDNTLAAATYDLEFRSGQTLNQPDTKISTVTFARGTHRRFTVPHWATWIVRTAGTGAAGFRANVIALEH